MSSLSLPRAIGHRGAAAYAPENTLEGIREAARRGARWVEVDAKLTGDGVVILMWLQVQEMLYIEKGGEVQIGDELRAYNPLIPNGRELVATVLFEIDDPVRRKTLLARLGGIEDTAFIRVGEETMTGVSEADIDRTSAEGKASAVQFIHFPFTTNQIAKFRAPGAQIIVGFTHQAYGHMVVMM